MKYPSTTDCDGLKSVFVKNEEKTEIETFKSYAEYDKLETLNSRGAGYYMCYCKKYYSLVKFTKDKANGKIKEGDLCYDYY